MALTAPSFRAVATGTADSTSSVTVAAPSGLQVGDLMVAMISTRGGSLSTPSGWTHVRTVASLSGHYSVTYVYRKIAAAGDLGASYVFATSNGLTTDWAGTIAAYHGHSPITPIIESTQFANNAQGTSITATAGSSAVTPVRCVVCYSASCQFGSPTPTITPGSGSIRSSPSLDTVRNVVVDDTSAPATARSATVSIASVTSSVMVVVAPRFYESPNAPTLDSLVSGAFLVVDDQTLDWTPSFPDSGDVQTGAEVEWRVDGGAATTIVVSDATSQTTITGGTISAGAFEWRARVKGTAESFGPWSSWGFSTASAAPAPPTIVTPTDLATITTSTAPVELSHAEAFTHFRARTVADLAGAPDESTVYEDTGVLVGSSGMTSIDFDETGRTEHVQGQVKIAATGFWTQWASHLVVVEFTPPATPTVVIAEDSPAGAATISATHPTPVGDEPTVTSMDLWRRRRVVDADGTLVGYHDDEGGATGTRLKAGLGSEDEWVDGKVAHRQQYEYRWLVHGDNGARTWSLWTVDATPRSLLLTEAGSALLTEAEDALVLETA